MERTRVVDCRWLGSTGLGRVNQRLLEGLAEVAPSGRWVLWGPSAVAQYLWPGAELHESRHSPFSWAGQRDALALPSPRDATVLFLHAVRPLHVRRCLVLIHDTIPLHWGGTRARRAAWRRYFRLSAHRARGVFVYSEATARQVTSDLGLTPVGRVHLPIDRDRALAVRGRRTAGVDHSLDMLYVGRGSPHKNLVRALAAFRGSAVERAGGRFIVVGLDAPARAELAAQASALGTTQLDLVVECTDAELDELYASAGFLIQPSLEEGFGLPVAEALVAGVPVCCSDIEALAESSQGFAETFDPWSVDDIRAAIDRTAARAADGYVPPEITTPSPRQFAEEVLALPW